MSIRTPARLDDSRGFTVPELVFVLAFIGVAFVVFALAASYMRIGGHYNYQNVTATRLAILEDATNMYILNIGSCPTTKHGLQALLIPPADLADPTKWSGPYLEKNEVPLDGWNNPFHYRALDPDTYRIWSSGPNGINEQGRGDDIASAL